MTRTAKTTSSDSALIYAHIACGARMGHSKDDSTGDENVAFSTNLRRDKTVFSIFLGNIHLESDHITHV